MQEQPYGDETLSHESHGQTHQEGNFARSTPKRRPFSSGDVASQFSKIALRSELRALDTNSSPRNPELAWASASYVIFTFSHCAFLQLSRLCRWKPAQPAQPALISSIDASSMCFPRPRMPNLKGLQVVCLGRPRNLVSLAGSRTAGVGGVRRRMRKVHVQLLCMQRQVLGALGPL